MKLRHSHLLLAASTGMILAGCQIPYGDVTVAFKPPSIEEADATSGEVSEVDTNDGSAADSDQATALIQSDENEQAASSEVTESTTSGAIIDADAIVDAEQAATDDLSVTGNDEDTNAQHPDEVVAPPDTVPDVPVITAAAEVLMEPPAVPDEDAGPLAPSEAFPVDLSTVLRLAGGHNWAVQLAWERVNQAEANVDAAEALWVPSLNLGIAATKHDGQIQATPGQIVDVSRNSLFIGGGAKIDDAPMAGGGGGPARLFVDLSLADAYFQPLVTRQLSCAARSRHAVEFNNAQMDAALAYFDLVAAQGEVAIADQNLADAEDLLEMTEAFVGAGKASDVEVSRVQVIVANQQQARVTAELNLKLASTELIRIVRLDPSRLQADALLFSADDHLLPIELIPEHSDLATLIAQGQRARPEVAERYALAQAERTDARSEQLRPFIPNVNMGMSAGVFGGGVGGNVGGLDGRSDFDAMLVWEVRNLGLGEKAARRESNSRHRQAVLSAHQMQDQIAADVRNGWHQVTAGRQRIVIAQDNVAEAARLLELNLNRIRGLEGLPLEAIQALNAVTTTRMSLLRAIVDYNKAQASLLRAVGRPVASAL